MSRSIRGIRHTATAGVVGLALLGLGAGCSSSKSSAPTTTRPKPTTTTTSVPLQVQGEQLRAYLAPGGKGAALLTLIRETAPISGATLPSVSQCKLLKAQLARQHLDTAGVGKLIAALPGLAVANFATVQLDRDLALTLCVAGKPLPPVLAAANPYQTRLLRILLARFNIAI